MFFEIRFAQVAAVRLHEGVDLVRDLALVKSVAAFLADQAQRSCEIGILEDVAFGRCAAFAIERVGLEKSAGQILVKLRTEMPVKGDQFADRKTFLGITNRAGKIVA